MTDEYHKAKTFVLEHMPHMSRFRVVILIIIAALFVWVAMGHKKS